VSPCAQAKLESSERVDPGGKCAEDVSWPRCTSSSIMTLPSLFAQDHEAVPTTQHQSLRSCEVGCLSLCCLPAQEFKRHLRQPCRVFFDWHSPVCAPISCPTMTDPNQPSHVSNVSDHFAALMAADAAPASPAHGGSGSTSTPLQGKQGGVRFTDFVGPSNMA